MLSIITEIAPRLSEKKSSGDDQSSVSGLPKSDAFEESISLSMGNQRKIPYELRSGLSPFLDCMRMCK